MLTSEEREAYRDKIKAQIKQWEARLEELRYKQEEARADTKIKLGQQLREAKRQRQDATMRLKALEGAALWHGMKDRLQSLGDRLRETIERRARKGD
jgi:hypothetical protein